MILRENGTRFYVEGKVLTIGGRISANGESEYESLFGTITEIRSGADRETENDVPDIYCDFETPVAEETLRELEERFSGLYGEAKTIDDISLDCVIMPPDIAPHHRTGSRGGWPQPLLYIRSAWEHRQKNVFLPYPNRSAPSLHFPRSPS